MVSQDLNYSDIYAFIAVIAESAGCMYVGDIAGFRIVKIL
jgi:hypothetical protein